MNPGDIPGKLREECGVFGFLADEPGLTGPALPYAILGLHALQHRGQRGTGIVTGERGEDGGGSLHSHHGRGLVSDVFSSERSREFDLPGSSAIGHVRYATAGSTDLANLQPFVQKSRRGQFALAHNGHLTNADRIRERLLAMGSLLHTDSDTEVILHLAARSERSSDVEAIKDALGEVEGAYSLVVLTPDSLIGIRDPRGMRPLTLGRIDGAWMLASESCAIESLGGDVVRDVSPGEVVVITERGLESQQLEVAQSVKPKFCSFEYIYFMRPNTRFEGRHAATVRERIGAQLFRESHADSDLVVPVPDSGIQAAVGYAEAAGLPFKYAILKSPYVGRTFIEPTQGIRNLGVKLKLTVDRGLVAGRRVTLVDDSIVRSTTMRKLVEIVRAAGASEIHVRISSPPFRYPCYYGIDTPAQKDLIAATKSTEEVCRIVGADSLAYVTVGGLNEAIRQARPDGAEAESGSANGICEACFTGDYPFAHERPVHLHMNRPESRAGDLRITAES